MRIELSDKAREALRHIQSAIMLSGRFPSTRELMSAMNYKSPRSSQLLLDELHRAGYLKRRGSGAYQLMKDIESEGPENIRTVLIPLVGSVSCGAPILAEENIEAMIPVSSSLLKGGSSYFLLRAKGDSMDRAGINEGDILLIKQQNIADYIGQKVVALIDDEATVKLYYAKGNIIHLSPRSSNPVHQPIILERNFLIQGVVVEVIPTNINS